MENFSYHVPFYVVTGGIKTSGHSSELFGGQAGLFDRSTFSIATGIGNGKEFYFAQGPIGGKDWYGQPVTESHKSPFFLGKDVENMYLSTPQRIQNEEWVIGFNGSATSVSLQWEKGKALRIQFYFHGNPTYRFFANPKTYVVSHTPLVDCSEPCNADDCPDGITDCLVETRKLIDKINEHTELKKFGVQAKIVVDPFSAVATTMEKYCLDLCDNGDAQALQAVQAQAPTGARVTRTVRSGSTSTYQFCQIDDLGAPNDFAQTASVLQAVCAACPSGSTLSPAQDVYIVDRPLAGTEDLSTSNLRQTYANTVGSAYAVAGTLVYTFNGASAVDPTTNQITLTAHGLVVGTPLFYSNGGGTTIVGLTNNTEYYVKTVVDANNITLSATVGGTVIDITADGVGASHTLAKFKASFVGQDGSVAKVKIAVPAAATFAALLSDGVELSHTQAATCTFATPSVVAWTLCGTGISSTRTLRINALNRPDCNTAGDRLADLTDVLAGVEGISIGTLAKVAGTGCVDDYTVDQLSIDCLPEDCLTNNVTFTYDELPAFESKAWEVVPPTVIANASRKCGIRITAGYFDPQFGNCSFDPRDYYETEPVKMELSTLGEDDGACDTANWPLVHQSKIGRIARQSGEWVVRETIMKTNAYLKHVDQYAGDARMREAFDMNLLGTVDRRAFYNLYYITYKASYGLNTTWRKNEQETFTTVFAFKEGDAAESTFQTQVLDVLTAKSGVTWHVNAGSTGAIGVA